MATLAPDIKALQARATQQAKTAKTEQEALLQATKSSDVSGQQAAGSALAKSGNALVSGFGQGLAAVSAIKEGSSRKKALEQLKTQVETQAAKQQELLTLAEEAKVTLQNTANAAPTMIDVISAVNNGTITPEEGDSRLTQAIIGTNPNRLEGTQASWNSEAQRIDLVKDGVVDSEGINNIINLLPTEELKFAANESLYGAATKQAQAEAQADIATAEAKAEAGRNATRDERIGLGLESTTQRTQEIGGGFQQAAEKALVQGFEDRVSLINTDAATARGQQRPLDLLVNNVDTANTGAAAPYLRAVDSVLKQGGFDAGLDPTGDLSQVATASEEFIKPYIEAQGKGFTDADRKAVERSIAGIGNSKEANRAFVTFANVNNQLKLQKQRLASQLIKEGRAQELESVMDNFDQQAGRTVISAINLVKKNRDVSLKDLMGRINSRLNQGE